MIGLAGSSCLQLIGQLLIIRLHNLHGPLALFGLDPHRGHLPVHVLILVLLGIQIELQGSHLVLELLASDQGVLTAAKDVAASGALRTISQSRLPDVLIIGLFDFKEEASEVLISLDDLIEGLGESLQLLSLVVICLFQAICQLLFKVDCIGSEVALVHLLSLMHRGVLVCATLRCVARLIHHRGFVQVEAQVLLRLDLCLTSGESHGLHIASRCMVNLAIGIGIVERVVEG